jgi:hypothetical protein
MRKALLGAALPMAAALLFSSAAMAQTPQPKPQQTQAKSPWKYYPTDVPQGDGGPAPKRDLSGTWNGPGSSPGVPRGGGGERPQFTPLAQQMMADRKPVGRFGPGATNDPGSKYCDPIGFPQNITTEGRALSIATMPSRVVILYQFAQVWREIWTDGRPLPTNVGGEDRDSLDPTFEGYSVGHWEDDYNFVVDTTGLDERTWSDRNGTPHTPSTIVHERWTRVDHNDMKLTVTIEDPKLFVKPYTLGTYNYKWNPNQKMNEWFCVPSETMKYVTEQAEPAGSFPDAPTARYGGGGGAEEGGAAAPAAGGGGAGRGGRGGRGGQ